MTEPKYFISDNTPAELRQSTFDTIAANPGAIVGLRVYGNHYARTIAAAGEIIGASISHDGFAVSILRSRLNPWNATGPALIDSLVLHRNSIALSSRMIMITEQ